MTGRMNKNVKRLVCAGGVAQNERRKVMVTKRLSLIVIVALLVLATLANAVDEPVGTFKIGTRYLDGTAFEPDTDILDIGDSLYLSIYADEGFYWPSSFGYLWALTTDSPSATITGGVKGPDAYMVVFYGSTNDLIGDPPDGQCGRIELEDFVPGIYGPGLYMDDFLYSPHSVGEAAVNFWHLTPSPGWEPYGVVDSIVITQVPEPMTITLLALGVLFLSRRKCKHD